MVVPVTGGACKLQWKADWAMRWFALGVDYEMSGKDLIESVTLSSKIVRVLGGTPPTGLSYELFLDQNGEKISKSKGNGLSVEEWLTYGSSDPWHYSCMVSRNVQNGYILTLFPRQLTNISRIFQS